jgi:hypothetical protein
MAEQLFLNKNVVDLFPKPITRKIQIGDIGDIASRKSTYSYSIKLPRTTRNTQILDMLGVIGNVSRKPFENVVADYIVDGIPLVINGYVVISSTTEFFEINVYDGVVDLGERLKGKTLSDLELSDLDHILTSQEVVDSFSHTEGFIYGLANFGLGLSSSVKAEKIAPSIYTHTLFRKIFESNGLNLVGSFFSTNEKYLTEVVTPVKGYDVEDTAFTSTSKGTTSTNTLSEYRTATSYITFEKEFTPSGALTGASYLGNKIVFSVAGTYKFNLTINYSSYSTYLQFRVKINGVSRAYLYLASQSDSGGGTKTISVTFSVQVGDEVSFWVNGSSDYGNEDIGNYYDPYDPYYDGYNNQPTYYQINYNVSVSGQLFLQEGGQLIKVVDYIGDTNQLDFIKDVIRRYGLVLNPIRNTSDYRFTQIEALLNDRGNAEDWTQKLKEIKKENYVSGYAQINKASYQYPEEIVVPNNDGEMLIENENTSIEKTMFTSIFEIPNKSGTLGGENVYSIPIWELKDGIVENKETPIKTMRIKRIDTSVNVKLFSEVTPINVTEDVPFLSLENMSMTYFLGNYYKAFQSLINDFREVEFSLNLTLVDIFNLDFFRLKYMKQTGRFYYLNSVTHTPEKLSKAVMIEIAKFPVNQPPSQVGSYSFSMSHDSTRTVTAANLLNGYFDPELDPALKIKFLSGFNSNLILRQAGVDITSETEILFEDLDLKIFDALGGLDAYSESWTFTIADAGSGQYSSEIGTLTANVIELVNQPPNANAGNDQTKGLYPEEFQDYPVYFNVTGAASYDYTGDIVSFVWSIQSQPSLNGGAIPETVLTSNINSPNATLEVPNDPDYVGTYVLKLVVTDEYGATDEDTVNLVVTIGDYYEGQFNPN